MIHAHISSPMLGSLQFVIPVPRDLVLSSCSTHIHVAHTGTHTGTHKHMVHMGTYTYMAHTGTGIHVAHTNKQTNKKS